MQYHIQTLVKHLFDKDSFEQVSEQELKQFTEAYPYAAVGQFLYAKKLHDAGAYNQEQGERASLYFHNSLWLRWLLNQQYEAAPVETMRAEEPAQQPAYRVVVQMPKQPAAPAPLVAEEPKIAGETIHPEATATAEAPAVSENGSMHAVTELPEQTPVPETSAAPVPVEEPVVAATETEKAPEASAEAVSAVAIAENSRLAEETGAESMVNAVSITEEVIAAGAAVIADSTENTETAAPSATAETIPAELLLEETPPTVDATPEAVVPEHAAEAISENTPAEQPAAPEPEAVTALEEQPPVEILEPVPHVQEPPAIEPPPVEHIEQEKEEPVAAAQQQEEEEDRKAREAEEAEEASYSPASIEVKAAVDTSEPIFESYHTIDYFASQGIKLRQEEYKDRLGKQLKSFTEWLRSMKRIAPTETNTSIDEITNRSIQRIAENSVTEKEVVTEAMAEVWAKQGHPEKAIAIYEKLSLLNPAKRTYFAGRIEQLKAL